MSALKIVRAAETAIGEVLEGGGLTKGQRKELAEVVDTLTDLDTFLLSADLRNSIAELKEKSVELQKLNDRTQEKMANLEKVAKAVAVAAKVIDGLAKAIAVLLKVGLL